MRNTAVVSHPLIAGPVTTIAETVVTDQPVLTIEKMSAPLKPGANKPMAYTLTVANRGQPAHHLDLTVTIVDPIFRLSKHTWPDPPGSNREMTYTLDVLNQGSLATDLVITDRVPTGVTYVRGSTEDGGIVSWAVPRLDTGESTRLTYTVYVSDVMDVPIVNSHYGLCSAEQVCQPSEVLTSVVRGPTFEATAALDPIAKKPGGGGGPVTPTLVVRNVGPGNALTDPVSDTATCKITHLAHLNPVKSAPAVIGRGRIMTYSIGVWNSALATDEPPYPTLWEALPVSGVTVLSNPISHGGKAQTVTLTSTTGVTASPGNHQTSIEGPGPERRDPRLCHPRGQPGAESNRVGDHGHAASGHRIRPWKWRIAGEQWVLRWTAVTLEPGESREFGFAVTVIQGSGEEVVNDRYGVTCAERITTLGDPVITKISREGRIYLPLVMRRNG